MEDFTPTGLKVEGSYENDRNRAAADCFKRMIREAFGVTDVIVAHHLTYVAEDKRADGFTYETVEEIPSADTLLFDHDAALKIWGANFKGVLRILACHPVEHRDDICRQMYEARDKAIPTLADILRQAEEAHKASGSPSDNWAEWYASYIETQYGSV